MSSAVSLDRCHAELRFNCLSVHATADITRSQLTANDGQHRRDEQQTQPAPPP